MSGGWGWVSIISVLTLPVDQHPALWQGYGTSEIQFGHALKKHDRSRFILQTKAPAKEDPKVFREALELSFKKLQVRAAKGVTFTFPKRNGRFLC